MYKVRAKLLGTDDYYNFEVEEDATYQNIVHIVAIKLNKKENNLFVTVDKEKKNKDDDVSYDFHVVDDDVVHDVEIFYNYLPA